MKFKRARSEEQREQRRQVILDTASAMLTKMRVDDLSLNELSRRVGLAKSNVLRYFESREAILLELLDEGLREWIRDLARVPTVRDATARERGDHLAENMALSLAARPVLCDLISAQPGVLERNVSSEVVLRHKRATMGAVDDMGTVMQRHLPELRKDDAFTVFAFTLLMTSGAWPHSRPTAAVLEAYAADAAVAAMQMDFATTVRQMIELSIAGLLVQRSHTDRPRSTRSNRCR